MMMQENSSQAEHAAALHIAELEREATDSRDVHLSLAAQHQAKVCFQHRSFLAMSAAAGAAATTRCLVAAYEALGILMQCIAQCK